MKVYEYIVDRFIWWDAASKNEAKLSTYLNQMGDNGWELIETRPSRAKCLGDLFIFKRELDAYPLSLPISIEAA